MDGDQRDSERGTLKKLRAAVRRWIGGAVPDESDDALAAFGLQRTDDSGLKTEEPFAVFCFNWRTLHIFLSTWNQWHVVVGKELVRMGMNWGEVEAALKLSGIKRREWTVIFEGLLAMQDEAINILKE